MSKRIMVIGCCGAGKSTISFALSEHFGLPLFHLDQLFWEPGWVQSDKSSWKAKHEKIIIQPEWLIDGNYSSTMDERLECADLIICMNLPRWMCLWGIIKRRIQYRGKVRPDMTEGCQERLDWEFIKYVWSFHSEQLPDLITKLDQYEDTKLIYRVRSRSEAKDLLERITTTRFKKQLSDCVDHES